MNEDKDSKVIRTGLDESDVSDYVVSAEPEESEETAEKHSEPKTSKRRSGVYFLLGLLFGIGILTPAMSMMGLGRYVPESTYQYYSTLASDYGKYAEIMKFIDEDPLAKSDVGRLSDEELKELVANIGDPYAQYYTAEEYEEFEKRYIADYVGIGIGVLEEDGNIVIKSVFEGESAEAAGIEKEDIIKKVDGTEPKDVDEAIALIKGESGTKVKLEILRGDELMEFDVTRETVEQESVAAEKLPEDESIGYIRITSFRNDTAKEFKNAVKDLKGSGCERFIIDLRSNGGGLTNESIEIADYLLPECKIMSEKKKDGSETVYNSKESSAGIEYVVLTDENTASASEILTAAIKDNKGGTVIGKKTYGKGVTQLSHKFKDGSAIKITTTEYFRPNGKTVNEVGIEPDIEAEFDEALDVAIQELNK